MLNNSMLFTSTFAPNPFGYPMDGRAFSSDKYRFGFNGKENDNEVKGEGNSLDFGGRIYDSRLGRWLSLDPLQAKYPEYSPYNFCLNNPVRFIDPNGLAVDDPPWVYGQLYSSSLQDGHITSEDIKKNSFGAAAVLLSPVIILGGEALLPYLISASPTLMKMAKSGAIVSVINGGVTAYNGGDAYEVSKSMVSGFFAGAALAFSPTTLVGAGFGEYMATIGVGGFSGFIENAVSQAIDGTLKGKEFNITDVLMNGGINAVSNLFAVKAMDIVKTGVAKWAMSEKKLINSSKNIAKVRVEVGSEAKRLGWSKKQISAEVKKRISNAIKSIDKQATQLNSAAEKSIDSGLEQLKSKTK